MDIGRDLSYNENTAHSGNLLEGEKPGRETMQRKKEYKFIEKMRLIGLLLTGLLLLSGCTKKEEILLLNGEASAEEERPAEQESVVSEQESVLSEPDRVCVHVCGAVKRPGVYELSVGCRVYEAVQAAGGFAENADQDYVNQAQTLADGVKLVIPTLEEAALARTLGMDSVTGEQEATAEDSRININTATEMELCNIPGIGATRAAAIAAYRESHGGFQKPEDIMKVNGIKEGMYEKIKDSIRVN